MRATVIRVTVGLLLVVIFATLSACSNEEDTIPTSAGTAPPLVAAAPAPDPVQVQEEILPPAETAPSPPAVYSDSPLVGRWNRTDRGHSSIVEFFSDGTGIEVHGPDYNEWTIFFEWSTSDGRLTVAHLEDTGGYSIWGDGNRGAVDWGWIGKFDGYHGIDMAERIDEIQRGSINSQLLRRRLGEPHEGLSPLTGSWEWHPSHNDFAVFTVHFNPDGTGVEMISSNEFHFMWTSEDGDIIEHVGWSGRLRRVFSEPLVSSVNYSLSNNDLTLIGYHERVSFIRLGGS